MAWATPEYDRSFVNAAGRVLIDPSWESDNFDWQAYDQALQIINNWRSSHSFPLNTMQNGLRAKARQVTGNTLVAQRIKRLSSIAHKLERFPKMKLSQMQDIGGCRAIIDNTKEVSALAILYKRGNGKHKIATMDDYIIKPRASGYRGIHFVYRYYSDRNKTYNDLKIEIQLRSSLQHAWATAVETVGTFTQQALKSSIGEQEWLRFFQLMGTAVAKQENTPPVPNTPTDTRELVAHLRTFSRNLDVKNRLEAYGDALRVTGIPQRPDAHYYLLELDTNTKTMNVESFNYRQLQQAQERYTAIERSATGQIGKDAVLVSVDHLDSLRRAYPNYFLDTRNFVAALREMIGE